MSTRWVSVVVSLATLGLLACIEAKSPNDRADAGAPSTVDGGHADAGIDAPLPTPATRFGWTSAGGSTGSTRFRARVSVGAPVVGAARSPTYRALVGPGVLTPADATSGVQP